MAVLKSSFSILTIATLIVLIAAYNATPAVGLGGRGGMVGGRTEIKDVKSNQEVQDLGRFSVQEFNRSSKQRSDSGELRFNEVVEAQTQVVSGIKYYLKISATEDGVTKMFESVVVVKPWVHQSKQLISFAPSTH